MERCEHGVNPTCCELCKPKTPTVEGDLETLGNGLRFGSTARIREALSRIRTRLEELEKARGAEQFEYEMGNFYHKKWVDAENKLGELEQTIENYKAGTAEYLRSIEFKNVKSREALAELGRSMVKIHASHSDEDAPGYLMDTVEQFVVDNVDRLDEYLKQQGEKCSHDWNAETVCIKCGADGEGK